MIFWLLWSSLLCFFTYPAIDLFFDSTISRHMIYQPLIFILFGFFIGQKIKINFGNFNYFGISGLILFIGNYIFWMTPRAIDLTLISGLWDKIFHFSFFVSGIILSRSINRMSFFIRASFGVNFLSMFSALGFFYLKYETQACTSYPLFQQKEAGIILLIIAFSLWVWQLYWIFTRNYKILKV
jgi:hypothetical protein